MEAQEGEKKENRRGGMNGGEDRLLGADRMKKKTVSCHSHLQDRLQLLQFGFLLLDFTVVVLAQFNQQQTGDIQHFLC